jgi:transcriptional regulator with XRE-family HTH domain
MAFGLLPGKTARECWLKMKNADAPAGEARRGGRMGQKEMMMTGKPVLAARDLKNSGRQSFVQKLRHDKRIQPTILQASRRFLLNTLNKQSAMAPRYTVGRRTAPNPTDQHVGRRVRMRRLMLAMSQEKLAAALGLSFQQVQKYERGANRIGASRLQQISHILQVPVEFFFEGAPNASAPHDSNGSTLSMAQIDEFVSDLGCLRLMRGFMRIDNAALRRKIVMLVHEIAGDDGN